MSHLYQVARGDGKGWSNMSIITGYKTGNIYRLYKSNPAGAYDAKGGMDEDKPDAVNQIVDWALNNLTPEDIQRLSDAFNEATATAMDEPVEGIEGILNKATRMSSANLAAQDRAVRSGTKIADRHEFEKRFPNANRLKIG